VEDKYFAGRRTGEAPEPKLAEVLLKQVCQVFSMAYFVILDLEKVNDARELTNSKQHVARGIKITPKYFKVRCVISATFLDEGS